MASWTWSSSVTRLHLDGGGLRLAVLGRLAGPGLLGLGVHAAQADAGHEGGGERQQGSSQKSAVHAVYERLERVRLGGLVVRQRQDLVTLATLHEGRKTLGERVPGGRQAGNLVRPRVRRERRPDPAQDGDAERA